MICTGSFEYRPLTGWAARLCRTAVAMAGLALTAAALFTAVLLLHFGVFIMIGAMR